MIAAIDILDEVEADVVSLNGEIVRRAYHGHCCKFFNEQEEFSLLLKAYVDYRLKIHRLKIEENKMWRSDCQSDCNLRSNHYALLHLYSGSAIELRWKLEKLWPCAACVWLYNPTNRIRRFPQLA